VTYRNVTVLPYRIAIARLPRIPGAKSILLEDLSTLPISNLTQKIASVALAQPTAAIAAAAAGP
jgi:hypothetical protein